MDVKLICNTPDEDLFGAVAINSRRDLPWVRSEGAREGHACLVGGGPSLADTLPSLERRIRLGQTVFALNGAAKYLNDHGIVPDHQVILDACGNATLSSLVQNLSSGTVRARIWQSLVAPSAVEATVASHWSIYNALVARDAERAAAADVMHLGIAEEWLRRFLAERDEPTSLPQ